MIPVADVDHVLALWDDPNFTESVTFHNSETSYEVFSVAPKIGVTGAQPILNGGPVDGGVLVTSPDGTRTEILCDPHSIELRSALMRFARLPLFKDPDHTMFADCVEAQIWADVCAQYQLSQYNQIQNEMGVQMNGLTAHLTWSLAELDATFVRTLAVAQDRDGDVDALQKAQDLWDASRSADCALASWTIYNIMDSNVGTQGCNFDYTIKRIRFLRSYASGLEFDG